MKEEQYSVQSDLLQNAESVVSVGAEAVVPISFTDTSGNAFEMQAAIVGSEREAGDYAVPVLSNEPELAQALMEHGPHAFDELPEGRSVDISVFMVESAIGADPVRADGGDARLYGIIVHPDNTFTISPPERGIVNAPDGARVAATRRPGQVSYNSHNTPSEIVSALRQPIYAETVADEVLRPTMHQAYHRLGIRLEEDRTTMPPRLTLTMPIPHELQARVAHERAQYKGHG